MAIRNLGAESRLRVQGIDHPRQAFSQPTFTYSRKGDSCALPKDLMTIAAFCIGTAATEIQQLVGASMVFSKEDKRVSSDNNHDSKIHAQGPEATRS